MNFRHFLLSCNPFWWRQFFGHYWTIQIRVGRNIEFFFRYYWTSVLEFFSVFNSIEISVLNIFNIQYYWTVLLIFTVIPKKPENSVKILKIFWKKSQKIFWNFFLFNIKHYRYWTPKNTEKNPKEYWKSWKKFKKK